MTRRGSVVVAYCHPGVVDGQFTHDLVGVVVRSVGRLRGQLAQWSGPRIASARNEIVRKFLNVDAEWLWMVDTDMGFAPDTLERLLESAHWRDRPIMGALCFGSDPSVRAGIFPTTYRVRDDGQVVRWVPDDMNDVVRVAATGAACVVIHRTVLEKVGAEYAEPWPWFQETSNDGTEVGEDVTFFLRAGAHGFPTHVDCRVETEHWKQAPLTRQLWEEYRNG